MGTEPRAFATRSAARPASSKAAAGSRTTRMRPPGALCVDPEIVLFPSGPGYARGVDEHIGSFERPVEIFGPTQVQRYKLHREVGDPTGVARCADAAPDPVTGADEGLCDVATDEACCAGDQDALPPFCAVRS